MFGDYTRVGNFQVPQTWRTRQAGEICHMRVKLKVELNPAGHGPVVRRRRRGLRARRSAARHSRREGRASLPTACS